MTDVKSITGMSDAAVEAKTGKTWGEWFRVLDREGAKKMAHRDIARLLHTKHKVPGWWAQMVTVGYERVRGLRQIHQKASGFSAGLSKTLAVPLAKLYRAWENNKLRSRWLGEAITVRKATKNKSMRITWRDGRSGVNVNFYARGAGKSQVTIEHEKLPSAKEVSAKKGYWGKKLERLASVVTD